MLVEGTALAQAAIAARAGVSQSTVFRLMRPHGWVRPAEAERWKPLVAAERAGLGPPLCAAFGRVAGLAEREHGRLVAERGRIEAAIGRAARIAASARRRAALHGRDVAVAPRLRVPADDGTGPVRLSVRRRGRAGAALPGNVVAKAREMVERTLARQSEIARQLGISRATLVGWIAAGGWLRPPDAPSRFGGARPSSRWHGHANARIAARRELEEAERGLDGLEGGQAALAEIEAAFGAVARVVAGLRPPGPRLPRRHSGRSEATIRNDEVPS